MKRWLIDVWLPRDKREIMGRIWCALVGVREGWRLHELYHPDVTDRDGIAAIKILRDPTLERGSCFLIGQSYSDWRAGQPSRADVSFAAWVEACVRRVS